MRSAIVSIKSACCVALFFASSVETNALAAGSDLPPEIGYQAGLIESPRIAGMGGALRAFSNSTEALFVNPANMAATRVYHLGALAQILPQADRQTYGIGIVDSIVSASRLAGGIGGTWSRQDPDGANRTSYDARFALAYPFSDSFFLGATARYLSLKENGFPRGAYNLHPSPASSGLGGQAIVKAVTFDAGLTVKPVKELAMSLVGYNLTDPGNGFVPLMFGGGAAYGSNEFTLEGDALFDFTTYGDTKAKVMGGGEYLAGDHFPVRAGYRYDQGAKSSTLTGGLGYVDRAYSFDIAIQRTVSGESLTAIILGFKYHVESGSLTSGGEDF